MGEDWSADSKRKNDLMCAVNDATACEIKMRLKKRAGGQTEIMYMDTFALVCRPNACLESSSWEAAVSELGNTIGPSAFFWTPKNDPITSACAADPSSCRFRFRICGATVRFPYKPEQVINFSEKSISTSAPGSATASSVNLVAGTTSSEDTTDLGLQRTSGKTQQDPTVAETPAEGKPSDLMVVAVIIVAIAAIAAMMFAVFRLRILRLHE